MPLYENIASKLPSGINLLMGADVNNINFPNGHSGVSSSVPGPVLQTTKSAISVKTFYYFFAFPSVFIEHFAISDMNYLLNIRKTQMITSITGM